ncbi:MAG: hypothetical protein ABIS14_12730 [Sphingomonas sp.]
MKMEFIEPAAVSELIEAATIARNQANARGDYGAPYVGRLTAALKQFPAPWRDEQPEPGNRPLGPLPESVRELARSRPYFS